VARSFFEMLGTPKGRGIGAAFLWLLSFCSSKRKVGACLRRKAAGQPPARSRNHHQRNHIRRKSLRSLRPTIRAMLKSKLQYLRAFTSKRTSKHPPILGLRNWKIQNNEHTHFSLNAHRQTIPFPTSPHIKHKFATIKFHHLVSLKIIDTKPKCQF
jgi:hypothetical protein